MKYTKTIKKYKPGVKRSTHLVLAGGFWSAIGAILFLRGGYFLYLDQLSWLIIPAIGLGILKSYIILDKSAKKTIFRILSFPDGICMGAVFSKLTWLLVIAMSVFGMILRGSGLPKSIVGFALVTVGFALVLSSRHAWVTWYDHLKNSLELK